MEPEFQPYGLPHITVIFVTIVLPFAFAAIVRRTKSQRLEKIIIGVLSAVLILNYVIYLIFIRSRGLVDWRQILPMQMCDWGMVVVIVAMWTGNQRWFEVAYFWGIGGTLHAKPALWFSRLAVHQFFYLALRYHRWRRFPDADPAIPALSHVDRARVAVV